MILACCWYTYACLSLSNSTDIHAPCSLFLSCTHKLFIYRIPILHLVIVHVSGYVSFYSCPVCIFSLVSIISHSDWSLPKSDRVFFLGMYQNEHTASSSRDHYSCVALIYISCVAFIHCSCISYTAIRPRLVSVFYPFIISTPLWSLTSSLSCSCIMSSIERLAEEIRVDGYKALNSHRVFSSLV